MSEREPVAMTSEFEGALRHDVFYLGCGLDGDDCMRLFNEIDALRARVDELTRERDEARDKARAALGGRRSTDALAATSKEDGNATPASTTWPWVLAFAHEMERKLSENRHKGDRDGWAHADALELMSRLRDEVDELHDAICRPEGDQCGCRSVSECYHSQSYDEHEVVSEAADVANFAMMIADVAGRLSPDGPSKEDSDG